MSKTTESKLRRATRPMRVTLDCPQSRLTRKGLSVFDPRFRPTERLCGYLAKAKRLTQSLVATLTFFFMMVNTRVQALDLAPAIEQAMLDDLIPALYLERAAARSTRAEHRHRLRGPRSSLRPHHPFAHIIQDSHSLASLLASFPGVSARVARGLAATGLSLAEIVALPLEEDALLKIDGIGATTAAHLRHLFHSLRGSTQPPVRAKRKQKT